MIRIKPVFQKRCRRNNILLAVPFLLAGLTVFAALLISKAFATDISSTIILNSQHANYDNNDGGAWKVTKNVQVENMSRVKTTVEVNTRIKGDGESKDVLFVVDTSGSMQDNGKIDDLKTAMLEVAGSILANGNNLVGLIDFSTEATILSEFTDNWDTYGTPNLSGKINGLYAGGGTNYYQAILKIEELFSTYDFSAGRTPLVVFFTDGAPIEDNPSQIPEYQIFKNLYPDVPVRAIQYDMGNAINQAIAQVSDVQYIAQVNNLTDVLFEVVEDGYRYDEFTIDDYINSSYFAYDSSSTSTSLGTVEYDSSNSKIHWDLSHALRSGRSAKLTFYMDVTNECINNDTGYCKTSIKDEVSTKINGNADEYVTTTDSPTIRFRYDLSYDVNSPSDCVVQGEAPDNTTALIYTTQELPTTTLTCSGYVFKGWGIGEGGAMRFNDDYFQMPEANTVIRAAWSKNSIEKSMEGEISPKVHAMLSDGWDFPRTINGTFNYDYSKVKKLKNAYALPEDYDTSTAHNYSITPGIPIYIWYDPTDYALTFYSDADILDLNPNSYSYFENFYALEDISILKYWNASTSYNLTRFFAGCTALTDYSPIADWDVSNVTSFANMLVGTRVPNYNDFSKWQTSSLTSLQWTFAGAQSESFAGLENWDTSHVTNMYEMFKQAKITSLTGLEDWDTSSVTNLGGAFRESTIGDYSALADWDVSHVQDMTLTFYAASFSNLHGLEDWDVSSVTNMYGLFNSVANADITAVQNWPTHSLESIEAIMQYSGITSTIGLKGWDVTHVTNSGNAFNSSAIYDTNGLETWDVSNWPWLENTFSSCGNLSDLSGISSWRTSSATRLVSVFSRNRNLSDLRPLKKWDVSNVTTINALFLEDGGITTLDGLEDWNVSSLTDASYAFYYTNNLTNISALANWNVTNLSNLFSTWRYTWSLSDISALSSWRTPSLTNLDSTFNNTNINNIAPLANWDVSHVTNFSNTFNNSKIPSLAPLSGWRPSSAPSFYFTFANNPITTLGDLNSWTSTSLTNLQGAFRGTQLTSLNGIGGWDVSKVTNLNETFQSISTLTDISALSSWNTNSLTSMSITFESTGITSLSGLETWTTTNLVDLSRTFGHCHSLSNISALGSWDVGNVTTMFELFFDNPSLQNISSLSGWTTSDKLTELGGIFRDCNLSSLQGLENFNTINVRSINRAFTGNTALTDVSALRDWDVGHVTDATYAFLNDSSVMDFTSLDGWNTESFDAHAQGTFNGTNASAQMPSWY